MLVLVVDDSRLMRQQLKDILLETKLAVHVLEASDGIQAIKMYRKYKPFVVTMDYEMPAFNGLDAAKEILKDDKQASIIMISSKNKKDFVEHAIKEGIRNYLVKPVTKEQIVNAFMRL